MATYTNTAFAVSGRSITKSTATDTYNNTDALPRAVLTVPILLS